MTSEILLISGSDYFVFVLFFLTCNFWVISLWCLVVRSQFVSMLFSYGGNFMDPRGRLLPRTFDLLGANLCLIHNGFFIRDLLLGLIFITTGFRFVLHICIPEAWSRCRPTHYDPLVLRRDVLSRRSKFQRLSCKLYLQMLFVWLFCRLLPFLISSTNGQWATGGRSLP